MTFFIVLLVLFVLLGIASALGWTTDSRDPAFGLGAVARHRGARR